jgi:regulator of protease activity HflC (stomatin/prohibitin superfamily)
VPQQHAWVVERLGQVPRDARAGLNSCAVHRRVAYSHSLKEIPLDVPSQVCITRDNTQLQVDGILYFQVTDAMRASYGSSNYDLAITQLAQTTLRSVIGRWSWTRPSRSATHQRPVVSALDDAARTGA